MMEQVLRVLAVDDDPEDLEILRDLLEEARPGGFQVVVTSSVGDGLAELERQPPDVCLVDYRLGARTGIDFIAEARARFPAVPVVLMTGGGDAEVDRRAMDAGAVDYLPKADLTPDRLERTIRYAVERARRQLAESRFRALIEQGHDLVTIVTSEGFLTYVSPSVFGVLGFTPEEKVGTQVLPEVHPEDRGRVEARLRDIVDGVAGDHVRIEPHRIRHRDGSWRWLDVIATDHRGDPTIAGIVVHARDVTAEMEIRDRLRFQADLLSAVGESVIATDPDGTITYWNPAAEQIYGWTAEEALGSQVMDLNVPETTVPTERAQEIMDILRAGRTWRGEFEVRRKDGSTFTALVANSPIMGADGEVRGVIGVSSDISSLKATEAALNERIKELRTLHEVTAILNEPGTPVEDRLQRIVHRIPGGWLNPGLTEARLTAAGRTYASPDFRETKWTLSAAVEDGEPEPGRLDVAITGPDPVYDLGPFLLEERELLHNLAGLIGNALRREALSRRLASTLDALNEAVLVVRGRVIVDVNPATERIFGFSQEELIGTTTLALHVDEASFHRFGAESEPALKRDGVFRGKFAMRRKDGSVFQAEQTVSLLDRDEGHEGGVVSVVRDVSEQARAEAAVRASEERFRQIAEHIQDVFWISTADHSRIEYVSPAFATMWGRDPADLLADAGVWVSALLPSDRQRLLEARTRKDGYAVEYRIVRPEGEIRWIFDRAFPMDEESGVDRVIGVAEDITDRKVAEERFVVLSQEVADGIYVIAPDGVIVFATPAAESVLGYPTEELVGRNALDLVHPEDRDSLRDMLRDVVHRPGSVGRGQYRGLTAEGEVRFLESVGRNRIDHPAIGGLVVTTRDVTAQRRLEEQLRQSQKLEAVGRLAGGIAHDFNNLLTVIRSQTDLLLIDLEESVAPEPMTLIQELETVQAAADRAAALTSQLLAFSREQILQPRVVDMSRVVSAMTRLLERVIGEDIAFELDLPEGLPPVRIDPGQIEQAVLNLVINARDAMPDGGTLTLRTRHVRGEPTSEEDGAPRAADQVVLEVTDTGLGMDSETQSRIFEPFFSTKEKGKGTGLGLAMVYGVVAQSGGKAHVRSEPGAGATFTLAFPAVSGRVEEARPPSQKPVAVQSSARRVLVVEDDEAVRRVTTRILERAGIEVVAVASAEAGLDELSRPHAFDLLLTDLVLPGMSGRALVDRLQATGSTLPLLIMSGYAEDSRGEAGDLPENIAFIPKPFTPKALVEKVQEVIK
jgi:two-component system, cell cycle sensor histidine kinase and response regulator CckA